MRSEGTTPETNSTKEQVTNAAPERTKTGQRSSGPTQLTGNQQLERRAPQGGASPEGEAQESTALPAGTRAPDFTLRTTPDQEVSLSDFRGKRVVLAFYPEPIGARFAETNWPSTSTPKAPPKQLKPQARKANSGKCTTRCSKTSRRSTSRAWLGTQKNSDLMSNALRRRWRTRFMRRGCERTSSAEYGAV